MRAALAQRQVLSCKYDAVGGNHASGEVFSFKPYTLLFSQRAWYTIGHHGGRNAVRCLKLNRFNQCKLTDQTYEIPKGFTVAKHLGNAWRMIRGNKSYDVELRFDPQFAETVADTHWHKTQEVIWQEDGSLILCPARQPPPRIPLRRHNSCMSTTRLSRETAGDGWGLGLNE